MTRIDEEAARRDRVGQAGERLAHGCIVWHKLIQSRNDAERGPGYLCREARAVERVAVLETRDAGESTFADERRALLDIERAVIAQQDGIGLSRQCGNGVEDIAAVPGGNVEDAH